MGMPEQSSDIHIKLSDPTPSRYGSTSEVKKQPLNPDIVVVSSDNWNVYFPDKPLTDDVRKGLESGLTYLKVAVEPGSKKVVGRVEVAREHENALSIAVQEGQERRGIATTLIHEAQKDHAKLHLLNFAGEAGKKLYTGLGFHAEGVQDHFAWVRPAPVSP